MVSSGKRFAEHSVRWQREARRDGVDPVRWNRWLKLSAKTRKRTKQRDYARGATVRTLLRRDLEQAALRNMRQKFPQARESTIRRGVSLQTTRQLLWTAKASGRAIVHRAGIKPTDGKLNLWWYN